MGKVFSRLMLGSLTLLGLATIAFSLAIAQSWFLGVRSVSAEMPPPVIEVQDQAVVNNTITADKVVANQDGWVAVQALEAQGKPILNLIVGRAKVRSGTNTAVKIQLSESFQPNDQLLLVLHVDQGTPNRFEFPSGEDVMVEYNGEVVAAPLSVLPGAVKPPTPELIPAAGLDSLSVIGLGIGAALMLVLGVMLTRKARRRNNIP